jgi:hypothetical protein
MNAERIEILTFGCFGPESARRRLWVPPGRGVPVTRLDLLMIYVDRVDDRNHVVFQLHGPSARYGRTEGERSLMALELNFDAIARAIRYDADGRVDAVLVEIVNLSLAARAS